MIVYILYKTSYGEDEEDSVEIVGVVTSKKRAEKWKDVNKEKQAGVDYQHKAVGLDGSVKHFSMRSAGMVEL